MSQGPSCTGQGRGEVNPPGCGFAVVGVSPATSTEAEDFCRSQAERQGWGWRCRPHAAEPGPQGARAGVPSPGSPQRCCLLCTPPQPLPSEGRQGWAVLSPRLRFVFSVLAGAGDSSHGFAALDSRSAQSPQVSMASMSLGCQSFAAEALRDLVPGAGDCPRDTLGRWPCCCVLSASHSAQAASAPRTELVPEARGRGGPGTASLGSAGPALLQPSAMSRQRLENSQGAGWGRGRTCPIPAHRPPAMAKPPPGSTGAPPAWLGLVQVCCPQRCFALRFEEAVVRCGSAQSRCLEELQTLCPEPCGLWKLVRCRRVCLSLLFNVCAFSS
uniref:Uncharacterized protein n=1 Tax=Buteo japonicus TaxID=224669 RepID=A0A8C0BJ10_9AVES